MFSTKLPQPMPQRQFFAPMRISFKHLIPGSTNKKGFVYVERIGRRLRSFTHDWVKSAACRANLAWSGIRPKVPRYIPDPKRKVLLGFTELLNNTRNARQQHLSQHECSERLRLLKNSWCWGEWSFSSRCRSSCFVKEYFVVTPPIHKR